MSKGAELFASRPSIDFALFELTGERPKARQMIRCPLPGHDDSTPSFNLFDVDSEGVPQSFGCFGCGRKGDVTELTAELTGLSGDGLAYKLDLLLAAEESSSSTSFHRDEAAPRREPAEFSAVMGRLRANVSDVRVRGFNRYMDGRGLSRAAHFAQGVAGWVPGPFGTAVVPHYDPSGFITGIKYRSATRKWAEDGSRWPHLYGVWLDTGARTVLLCEGESDWLLAAWSLRQDPWIDVLALPSGAAAEIRDEWLNRVAYRRLILAFDADDAGRKAVSEWKRNRTDSLVLSLPEGEDLLSSGVSVPEEIRKVISQ